MRPIERPGAGLPLNLRSISPPQRNAPGAPKVSPTVARYSHFAPLHNNTEERLGLHQLHGRGPHEHPPPQETSEAEEQVSVPYSEMREEDEEAHHHGGGMSLQKEMERGMQQSEQEEEAEDEQGADERGRHAAMARGLPPWMDGAEGYTHEDTLPELNHLPDLGRLGSFGGPFGGDEGEMFENYPAAGKTDYAELTGGQEEETSGGYSNIYPRFGENMYSHYGVPFALDQQEGQAPHMHNDQGEPNTMPSSYGLFGWQPKPFGGSAMGMGGHLAMNIWGSETWGYAPSGPGLQTPSFSQPPGQQPGNPQQQYTYES